MTRFIQFWLAERTPAKRMTTSLGIKLILISYFSTLRMKDMMKEWLWMIVLLHRLFIQAPRKEPYIVASTWVWSSPELSTRRNQELWWITNVTTQCYNWFSTGLIQNILSNHPNQLLGKKDQSEDGNNSGNGQSSWHMHWTTENIHLIITSLQKSDNVVPKTYCYC